ncbi:pseudouridine synthase [Geobacter sp. DSM 9736]|uniref:pseudouridine synthase n=1 Tax=Geobacter sp. DSM 9736 TaxID=1277350 RepID=UPI000B511ECC|nr:pseudouridine synthase [Geobacter sp. DSM 9736]SNB47369.1 tRNA pseudouridine synthase C [Geobacter sp. DSM 9736]
MDVIYHDDHLIAVNKPPGMLVHRTSLDRQATTSILQQVRDRIGKRVYPVHRLDRPTSGVLLFALSPETAGAVAAQFTGMEVVKRYLAVVRGFIPEEGVVDYPLRDDPASSAVAKLSPLREAVSLYRRIATTELPIGVGRYPTSRYSLAEMRPMTGRRHQLRRHLKHILHPIIGDTNYGEGRHNRLFRCEFGCSRLLLASVELSLRHPVTGERLMLNAPVGSEFAAVMERFGWRQALPDAWLDTRL